MTTTITAAVLRSKGAPLSFEQLELDEPRADEVVVRMVATGVCHTDAHVRHQFIPSPLPIVLGHEGAGIVEKIGDAVTSVVPGDHVVMSFNFCGGCRPCWSGHPAYCDQAYSMNLGGTRSDGSCGLRSGGGEAIYGRFFGQSSFATHALAYQRNIVKVPKDLPLELLAPLGCGLQTGAGSILRALAMPSGASLAVFGVGAVGLSAVMAAKIAGATTIIAIDINRDRISLARELGATHSIEAGISPDIAAEIREITGRGVDFVLDTSGQKSSLEAGASALAHMGRFGFVAFNEGAGAVVDASKFFLGQALQGIVQGSAVPQVFIPELISLHRAGHFPFERLITFYAFSELERAFADTANGSSVKAVLRF